MSESPTNVLDIEKELDSIFWELLAPLRNEKRIDVVLFARFCDCLDRLILLIRDDLDAKERVVSFLYLVYEVLLAESKEAPEPEAILSEAKKLQKRLETLWNDQRA